MILLIWFFVAKKYKGNYNYKLSLAKGNVFCLIASELVYFLILYFFYVTTKNPEIASGFAWNYFYIYFRAIIPYLLLEIFTDIILKDPTWVFFIVVLLEDYIFLYWYSNHFKTHPG